MPGVSTIAALAVLLTLAGAAPDQIIDFPCFKNLSDGRVLVDGIRWDEKLRELGYELPDGAYVPYQVLHFELQTTRDAVWADGLCRMQLMPPQQ